MRYPAVWKCCCLHTMYHINNNAFSCVLKDTIQYGLYNMALIIASIKPINPGYFTIVCAHPGSATWQFYYRNVLCRLFYFTDSFVFHCVFITVYRIDWCMIYSAAQLQECVINLLIYKDKCEKNVAIPYGRGWARDEESKEKDLQLVTAISRDMKQTKTHPYVKLMVAHLFLGLFTVVNNNNVATATVVTQFTCILHSLDMQQNTSRASLKCTMSSLKIFA